MNQDGPIGLCASFLKSQSILSKDLNKGPPSGNQLLIPLSCFIELAPGNCFTFHIMTRIKRGEKYKQRKQSSNNFSFDQGFKEYIPGYDTKSKVC